MILENGLPKSVMDHLAECAEEMGEEFPTPISNKRKIRYNGRVIEIWFEETGTVYAWKAFVSGLGTFGGISEEEAIARAKEQI